MFSPDDIPYVAEELVIEEKEGSMYLVLAPQLPNCVSVNVVGTEIINLCDGTKTVKEITAVLSLRRGENPQENLPGIVKFFNYLEEKGFAFHKPVEIEAFSPKEPETLSFLWLNVTYKCNLRCRHCHSSFGTPLEDELTTEEIISVIRDCSHFPDCTLIISGGEPFCREDILDIVRVADRSFEKVLLVTNGTLIDDEKARALADLNIKIQISLEGPDAESNDIIRGKGVFEKAVQSIRKLKHLGMEPIVRMTLLKTNIDKIPEIIAFSKREGIGAVKLGTLQRSGRAYESIKDLDPDTEELIETYRRIRRLDPDFTYVQLSESLKPSITRQRMDLCSAGSGTLSVGADGGVYPCSGLMYPEFLAGNIRKKLLETIWKESPVLQRIRGLSVSQIPGCDKCPVRYLCGGGCLVDIYWEYGHLQGKTPRCDLLRAMKWDELKRMTYKTRSIAE